VSFVVAAASSAVPGAPGSPNVTLQGSDATGVTFSVSFATVTGASSYPYVAAFTDGTGVRQSSATSAPLQLRMAYHASGAASGGFICLRSANAAGKQSTDQSCNVLSVPARPVGSTPPPPPPSAPAPSASNLSPSSAVAGSGGFSLTVNGSGFVAASVVRWNGGTRATTFVSATQLRANIAASDLASAGPASVTVFTPTPGGGTSAALSFAITAAPAPPPPTPTPTTPPSAPGHPSLTQVGTDANGVTFNVAWTAGTGSTSYRYAAALMDGSAFQQGSVNGMLSFQLRMPYHPSGAATGGFVCVTSVNAAGQQSADQSCNAVSVPARPR